MTTIATRASRPMRIIRVCATGRVPFGFMPVTAAKTAMTTARLSHTSQFMVEPCYKTRASAAFAGAPMPQTVKFRISNFK